MSRCANLDREIIFYNLVKEDCLEVVQNPCERELHRSYMQPPVKWGLHSACVQFL